MKREKVIEIFLGLIFIILILIMIILFTNVDSGSKSSEATTTITNSFNTNTYNNYNIPSKTYSNYEEGNYNLGFDNKQYLKYSSKSYYNRDYGSKNYKVYVRNKSHKGGYFTVKFQFTDYHGEKKTESITHYLKPHEEKRFYYKNVLNDGREQRYWKYKVDSHTRY